MQDYIEKYYKRFANNFKTLRLENEYSQEKLAEKLNCSREYISRLENYNEKMSLQMLLKASFALKVSPEIFFQKKI